jgi:hypothetical protein
MFTNPDVNKDGNTIDYYKDKLKQTPLTEELKTQWLSNKPEIPTYGHWNDKRKAYEAGLSANID